jgi:hypothetical protein
MAFSSKSPAVKPTRYLIYSAKAIALLFAACACALWTIGNRYRVAGPFVEPSFGLVVIDWDATLWPTLTLQARGEDGSVGFVHEFSLGELQ